MIDYSNKLNLELAKIIDENNIFVDEPMKNHTSFKVGGPVDILTTPTSYNEVKKIVKFCKENNIQYYIIGNGSNLLVRDGGIRGVVVKLNKLNNIRLEHDLVISESGVSLSQVSNFALENNLTGFEFACGIPGSVGGAATMNAGAYNGEISNVISSAKVIDNNGEIIELSKEQLELGYRMSSIMKYGYTVLEVTFKFEKGEHEAIHKRIQELSKRREERQPLEYASAGSTFKRPDGFFAAKLIEDCDLKGKCIGGAQVSIKHSGFIINKGNATAKDILDLIEFVQSTVFEKYKVKLNTEVRIIGENL